MAAATKSDLLASATKTAKRKPTKKEKERTVLSLNKSDQRKVVDFCRVQALADAVKPQVDQRKRVGCELTFAVWTQNWFDNKAVPDNPYIVEKNQDGAKAGTDDIQCLFMVKERSSGLADRIPDPEDLPDEKTPTAFLAELIAATCFPVSDKGKTAAKKEADALKRAQAFVTNEVEITEQVNLAKTFTAMYYGEDETLKSAATKLLTLIQSKPEGDDETVEINAFTDQEREGLLVTEQVVSLKRGYFGMLTYCKTVEELRSLLLFCKVTITLQNVEFGISDSAEEKVRRMQDTVAEFLLSED